MKEQRFSYHRSVAPMLWALVAVACAELVLVHLLIALLWSPVAGMVVSVLTLAGVAWLVIGILSMQRLSVVLDKRALVMRTGRIKSMAVPLSAVAGLRRDWNADALKTGSVLRLSLLAYPNVMVDLVDPRPGPRPFRRPIAAIAHRLDDPAAFVAAVARLRGDDDH